MNDPALQSLAHNDRQLGGRGGRMPSSRNGGSGVAMASLGSRTRIFWGKSN